MSSDLVPTWPVGAPQAAPTRLPLTPRAGATAVYLPACINRIFGNAPGAPSRPTLPEALVAVSARAGLPVWIPGDAAGHCCATPWSSKGYEAGRRFMARRTADALLRWSDGGRLPIVIDASSCAHGLLGDVAPCLDDPDRERYERLEILDSVAWAHDRLLPRLEVHRKVGSAAVHPSCSTGHLGLRTKLDDLAAALADEVVVPAGTTCCGMAGDRGWLHPELPASALRDVRLELDGYERGGRRLDAHMCSNRTCEAALTAVTGRPYASFVLLLEELTRA